MEERQEYHSQNDQEEAKAQVKGFRPHRIEDCPKWFLLQFLQPASW